MKIESQLFKLVVVVVVALVESEIEYRLNVHFKKQKKRRTLIKAKLKKNTLVI
jgi:hypothetical protein